MPDDGRPVQAHKPHHALRPDELLLRGSQGRQQEGQVRALEGEALGLQAVGAGTLHQHRRLHPLQCDTGGQHRRPEVAARHGGQAHRHRPCRRHRRPEGTCGDRRRHRLAGQPRPDKGQRLQLSLCVAQGTYRLRGEARCQDGHRKRQQAAAHQAAGGAYRG